MGAYVSRGRRRPDAVGWELSAQGGVVAAGMRSRDCGGLRSWEETPRVGRLGELSRRDRMEGRECGGKCSRGRAL